MSQRGVSREMVDLVMTHGTLEQDKYILGRREALQLLDSTRLWKKKVWESARATIAALEPEAMDDW